MQFVIAASDDDFNHVFAIDKFGLKRIRIEYYDDLCPANSNTFSLHFPWEIIELCLLKLLDFYINSRNYSLAIQILTVNKSFMMTFYNRYFKTKSINHVCRSLGYHSRLSALFHLMYDIWALLQDDNYPYFEIEIPPYKGIDAFYPWNYEGQIEIFQYETDPAIVSNSKNIDYECYKIGELSTDLVMLAGKFTNGILKSNFSRTPVIYLRFINYLGEVLPRYEHIKCSREWFTFGLLMRKGFGYSSGVFCEVGSSYHLPDSTVFTENVLVEL